MENSNSSTIFLCEDWAAEMAAAVDAAKKTITLSAISLHPPKLSLETSFGKLWLSLCAAAKRGCTVIFYLPASSGLYPATMNNFRASQVAFNKDIKTIFIKAPPLLHAKCCIIDSKIVWIGSGNFTNAAAHQNLEFYIWFENSDIAQKLLARLSGGAGYI